MFDKIHPQQAYFTYKAQWLLLDTKAQLLCMGERTGHISNVLVMTMQPAPFVNQVRPMFKIVAMVTYWQHVLTIIKDCVNIRCQYPPIY